MASIKRIAHWTPRYVYDRIGLAIWERMHPGLPWLTPEAIRLLGGLLRPADIGLEWGSGRSTRWIAGRIGHLTSVESDPVWYEKVKADLGKASNVRYVFRDCPAGASDVQATAYASVADLFASNSLDFVLIDGQVRDICARVVLDKIRPGGVLVIDNCNWYLPSRSRSPSSLRTVEVGSRWSEVHSVLVRWRNIWTSNGVTDTAIWIRPAP